MRKFIVNVNGNSYSVEVEEVSSDGQVSIPVAPVQAAAPVVQPAAKPSGNGTPLTTPMPGMVMRYNVKNGDKVKVSIRFRGREIGHSKAGMLILENFAKETAEFGVIDKEPKMEGKSLVMFLAPKG